jgi:hypothetical protein
MPLNFPESDWKNWSRLAPILLNRFCDSVVAHAAKFSIESGTGHERYLACYRFIDESNQKIADVFNNRRRSNALFQIAAAVTNEIMSAEDLASFSEETRERVRVICAIGD